MNTCMVQNAKGSFEKILVAKYTYSSSKFKLGRKRPIVFCYAEYNANINPGTKISNCKHRLI